MSNLQETFDPDSAFHGDNILPAILITMTRLYDVQMLLLREANPEVAEALESAHSKGELFAPDPAVGVNDGQHHPESE